MAIRDWIDVEALPFETPLLLEDPQLRWLPRDWPGNELGIALRAHPSVRDFLRVRLREDAGWLEALVERAPEVDANTPRRCELAVMARIADAAVGEAPLEEVAVRANLNAISMRLIALAWLPYGSGGQLWR